MAPAEVPILVLVTPVNEFAPTCVAQTFRVREDAAPRTLLGSVAGADRDYPPGGPEFHAPGGPADFAVDRLSGTSWAAGWGAGWRREGGCKLRPGPPSVLPCRGGAPPGAAGL